MANENANDVKDEVTELASFDPTKKKRKKKTTVILEGTDDAVDALADHDYQDELLGRVFNILHENNPELAGDRRRTVMRPPQVLREGTKKTAFVNFVDLCETMHRQPDHVMAFLFAELGTSGSIDVQERLVVKGRFAPKNFEGILRRYINEYVVGN